MDIGPGLVLDWRVHGPFFSEKFKGPLVGGVKKWKDEKLVGGWKSRRIEKIWFSLMCVWLEG